MHRMKVHLLVTVGLAILTVIGCQKQDPPDIILTRCLDALTVGNVTEAYEYFSYDDQLTVSRAEFVQQHELSAQELCIAEMLRNQVVQHMGALAVGEDTATAVVTIITPTMMEKRFAVLFFEECSTSAVDSTLNPQGEPEWIYMTRMSGTILLRREERGWRIFGYWQRMRIQEAEASAIRLNYIQTKIEIADMRAFAFKGERTSYLTARVVNKGDETLRQVEIIVVCFNPDNRPCYSVTVYPVSPSGLPLGPRKDKTFRVEFPNVPVDWTGNVTAKIVNATFVQ
jgi:hypothetical protein